MDIAIFLNLAAVVTSAWAFAWGEVLYLQSTLLTLTDGIQVLTNTCSSFVGSRSIEKRPTLYSRPTSLSGVCATRSNANSRTKQVDTGPYGRIILAASFGTNIIVGIILCLAYSTPQAQKWHIAATLASLSHMAYAPKVRLMNVINRKLSLKAFAGLAVVEKAQDRRA